MSERLHIPPPMKFDQASFKAWTRDVNTRFARIAELLDQTKSGHTLTGNMDAGLNRLTRVATAVSDNDAVPLGQMQEIVTDILNDFADSATTEGDDESGNVPTGDGTTQTGNAGEDDIQAAIETAIHGTATQVAFFVGANEVTGDAGLTYDSSTDALTIAGQIISTLATGTAPFVVASTTKVTNLNVDLLDGRSEEELFLLAGRTGTTNDYTVSSDGPGTGYGSAVPSYYRLAAHTGTTGDPGVFVTYNAGGNDALLVGPLALASVIPFTPFNIVLVDDHNSGSGQLMLMGSFNDQPGEGSAIAAIRARGTQPSPLQTESGDVFFLFSCAGTDTNNSTIDDPSAAQLIFFQDGSPQSGYVPGGMAVITTNNAGVSDTRLYVDGDGKVAVNVDYLSGTGTIPTQFAVVGDFAAGTNMTEFVVGATGTVTGKPSAAQPIAAAGDTITADAWQVEISNTTGGSITLTSTPTIPDGVDGQLVTLLAVGTDDVVVQDDSSLAGSNLRLSAATITLSPRDNLTLRYSAAVGDWVQIGFTDVL